MLCDVGCFFNDTETTEIYTYGHTLSLHDALPISRGYSRARGGDQWRIAPPSNAKSTRIVAVFIARSSLQWLTSPPIRCPGDDMTMRGRFWMAWLAAATIAMGDRKSTGLNSTH